MVRVEKSLGVRRWTSVRLSADWWAATKRQTAPRRHRSGSLAADENCADQSPKSSSWHESDSYGDPTHLNLEKLNCIRQTGFIVRWKIFMKLVPWWIFHLNKFKQKLGSLTVKETELISTIIYGMQGKARSTRKSTKLNTGGPVWNAGSNIETGPAVRYVHHLFSLKNWTS